MEANHPHLTTLKSFYVEISRARDRAELVTDDRNALKERLEAVTGERIAALEAVGAGEAKDRGAVRDVGGARAQEPDGGSVIERTPEPAVEKVRVPKSVDRELGL